MIKEIVYNTITLFFAFLIVNIILFFPITISIERFVVVTLIQALFFGSLTTIIVRLFK